ncbi:hypothetical protein [Saccharopolyspora shandongensis]|uniref:hypothetical protein n=1 Tax=Saccharopolyspora shandongensis TaxID=418495 RepID=UPI0033C7834A
MTESFNPTHIVPEGGMLAWDEPNSAKDPVARLDASLRVRVSEQQANGWARIVCSNGWLGWVDGRRLQYVEPQAPAIQPETWAGVPPPSGPPEGQPGRQFEGAGMEPQSAGREAAPGEQQSGAQADAQRLPGYPATLDIAMWVSLITAGLGIVLGLFTLIISLLSLFVIGVVGGLFIILLEAGVAVCAWLAGTQGLPAGRMVLTVLAALSVVGGLVNAASGVGWTGILGLLVGIALLVLWWLPSTSEAMKAKQAQHRSTLAD